MAARFSIVPSFAIAFHAISLMRFDNVESLSIESYAYMHQKYCKEHGRGSTSP